MPVPTPAQLAAITAPMGPVLVVAGPGAGKTFCLIERIHHLVSLPALPPSRLLVLTFTNKAANEIRTRLTDRLGADADHITGGTLHALCATILRERGTSVGVPRGFGIADDAYQRAVLRRLKVPLKRQGQVLQLFAQARYKGYALTQNDERLLAQYESILAERELLDFDQLVSRTAELFRRAPLAAEEVAAQWDAVLVDEFQDLDKKQYAIIRVLANAHRNVLAVGDDEQSIFAWRGAEPAVLRLFQRDFGVATPVVLDRNLRCAKPIFTAARKLVEGNPALFDKQITAERESPFPVIVRAWADEAEEAAWIVEDLMADRAASGLPYSAYAVLYRQHAHAHRIERALLAAQVPCRMARGRALRDDAVIGYVIGALKLALAPKDPELLDLFAESQLPKKLLNRVRAATPDGDMLTRLRAFADTQARDADTKRAWRFIYHVENLAGAVEGHTTLATLVDELITLRIAT
ncbi:MAG: ATP-dependent helicase, partial [Gemmatimonadales bacterium]